MHPPVDCKVSREAQNTNLKRYMHPSVDCKIIYNGQDMEATIDRWMDKEEVVYI